MRRSNTCFIAVALLLGTGSPASAGADLRAEADREANRIFLVTRVAYGADYVLAIDVTQAPPSGFAPVLGAPAAARSAYTMYLVMSGVTSRGTNERNTGTQWQGRIGFAAERSRRISIGWDGTRGAWTPMPGGEVYAVDLAYRQGLDEPGQRTGPPGQSRPLCQGAPAGLLRSPGWLAREDRITDASSRRFSRPAAVAPSPPQADPRANRSSGDCLRRTSPCLP